MLLDRWPGTLVLRDIRGNRDWLNRLQPELSPLTPSKKLADGPNVCLAHSSQIKGVESAGFPTPFNPAHEHDVD
jgi:hypothetical protein